MNIFEAVTSFAKALEYGKQLSNASTWSSRASALSILGPLAALVISILESQGISLGIGATDVQTLANGAAILGVTLGQLIQTASNKDAGIKKG
jgi:hypothetical protein